MTSPIPTVRDLKVDFDTPDGAVDAVKGISFEVSAGECLGIVGESGSGKSQTVLAAMGLLADNGMPTGSVMFNGTEMLTADARTLRDIRGDRIAMIFQEPMTSLNPALTIGRQVGEPIEVHRKLPKPSVRERCLELLRKVRIPDPRQRIDAYPHQFSGGMRQRAMIAMSLACEPRLIIADEPTTALDVTVQAQVLQLLKELTRETNAALILITHDLGVVARYADRVNVMYAGNIVESGTAREIYNNPRHPYTIGLMNSMPRLDDDARASLEPIEGQPPDLANVPDGCPFRPRCRHVVEKCASDRPPLVPVAADHSAACWADLHAAG